jgi:tetratricopeptide (TPR) repeat protein
MSQDQLKALRPNQGTSANRSSRRRTKKRKKLPDFDLADNCSALEDRILLRMQTSTKSMKSLAVFCLGFLLVVALPPSLPAQKKGEANALARRGTEAAKNRQWDDAIEDLRKAAEMDRKYVPSLVAALQGRAAERFAQGQLAEAASDYDEVLKHNSRNTSALEGRASVAIKMNDMDKALALYSDLIKINPNEVRYLLYRSYIYEVKGDLKNSMADTEKVLKLQKDNADALARKARLQARQAQESQNAMPPVPAQSAPKKP